MKIPVWLWIQDPGARSITVAVPGLSVTATAKVTSTEWAPGEPYDNPDQHGSLVSSFTCQGLGKQPPSAQPTTAAPPCGYTYIWKSTADRTNGSGRWPLTVTAHWTVTWTATNGAGGALALQSANTVGVHVGEYRTVLIAPDQPDPVVQPSR